MIAICCMLTCNMAANAGNDKPIAINALPVKAQTLLNNHFNGQKVMLATIESGVINKSYDVDLQNGTKLEFDKKGNLTEIGLSLPAFAAILHVSMQQMEIIKILIIFFISHNIKSLSFLFAMNV